MSEPSVLTESRDGVAVVTLNRPARRNGVTVEMCFRLYDALESIAASQDRVVILRGAGNDFCVGADIGGQPEGGVPERDSAEQRRIYHASTLLHTMPQVTIAAIDGGCAGAGMGWAAACDLRFASAEARFNTAFLAVGFPGDMGLVWSLQRAVGPARAKEMLFFPGKVSATQALEWGLVTRLFDRADLHREAMAAAGQLAARDAFTLAALKANTLDAGQLGIAEYIERETARHLEAAARPGMAERMARGLMAAKGG